MGPTVEEEETEGGDTYGENPTEATGEVIRVEGDWPPPEENTDLPEFTLERAHLLLQEVYRDFPHHNDGLHLDGGVADDATRAWMDWMEENNQRSRTFNYGPSGV